VRQDELELDVGELPDLEPAGPPRHQRLERLPREDDAESAVLLQQDLELCARGGLVGAGVLSQRRQGGQLSWGGAGAVVPGLVHRRPASAPACPPPCLSGGSPDRARSTESGPSPGDARTR